MKSLIQRTSFLFALFAAGAATLFLVPVAYAAPSTQATASAFGVTITGGASDVVPTPQVSAQVVDGLGEESFETLIDVPAEPLAVSGTLTAAAAAHPESDIQSSLVVVEQSVAGPYNAVGVGLVEHLEVVTEGLTGSVTLLSADVVRAEAVGVCDATTPQYSANSEIVNLHIGGESVPLNEPVEQVIDGINEVLVTTGLDQVVDIQRNVVTELPEGGIAVDALVVTLLAAAGQDPLAQVRIAHGTVGPLVCGAAAAGPASGAEVPGVVPQTALDVTTANQVPDTGSLPATGTNSSVIAGAAALLGAAAVALSALRRRVGAPSPLS